MRKAHTVVFIALTLFLSFTATASHTLTDTRVTDNIDHLQPSNGTSVEGDYTISVAVNRTAYDDATNIVIELNDQSGRAVSVLDSSFNADGGGTVTYDVDISQGTMSYLEVNDTVGLTTELRYNQGNDVRVEDAEHTHFYYESSFTNGLIGYDTEDIALILAVAVITWGVIRW